MSSFETVNSINKEPDTRVLLSIRCMSLHIKKNAVFNQGLFQSVMKMATGTHAAKNEKRRIKVSQSVPFEISGRPPSLLYDFISQSEVFQDTPDVTPSLFTEIICPANMDCKIRVNVYYSSSLTGNKEIVLAGTTFNLMELMRYNKLFSSIMNSEHCVGAKAIIEVAPAFSCVLNQTALFPIKIPGRFDFSSPLVQHYCFFHEDDITSPLVDSQELMFEPRFSFRLPALFIQNTLDSLSLAVSAWKQRYELERMRQGRFRNDEEAFRNGWHVLRLTITGTNFFNTDGGPVKSSRGSRASNGSLAVSTNMCNESYVEAFVDNKLKTFSTPVGKTNIEHDNNAPVYGSNLHPGNRKGQDFVAAGSHVRLITEPKIYQFRTCESSDFSADQPKSLSGDVVSLHGTVNQFVMYVPDLESSCIRLNLYADFQDQNLTPLSSESEKDGTSASGLPLCGYGFVPLIEGEKISNVNIMLSESFSTYLEAEIRVKVAVESGNGSVSEGGENKEVLKRVAPSHFPATNSISAEKFKDNVVGNVDNTGTDRLKAFTKPLTTTAKAVNYDTAQVLSECYEWLWLIGYSGTDPLSFSKFNQQGEPSRLINANANVTPRVDCEYPLEWIAEHISSLEALQVELRYLLGRCVEMEAENMRFRASTKKKDREFQVLPTNLHYQMLLNRSHRRSDEGESEHSRSRNASVDENGVQRPDVIIVDSVTCGAPSPHGLGHKQGGLEAQESELGKERQQIELLKEQLKNVVADNTCLSPTGGAAQVLNKVGTLARAHETHTLQVAKRRMYSLSQALSTTVNGILMKLALLAEGHITIETAEAWKEHGILVLFEGLLSITGNERSMIEDTMVAVDSLRLFSIRLVECDDSPVVVNPSDEAPHTVSSTHRGRSGSAPVVHKQEFSKPSKSGSLSGVSSGHIRAAPSSIIAPGTANTTYSPIGHASYLESSYKMGMHVTLSGREVTVHVPKSAMAKLPQCISGSGEEGTVLRIVSVLVNQGIDIQQSIATAWSGGSSSSAAAGSSSDKHSLSSTELQHFINMRALKLLNDYCHHVEPVGGSTLTTPNQSGNQVQFQIHSTTTATGASTLGVRDIPIQQPHVNSLVASGMHEHCKRLDEYITMSNMNSKNVEMLLEAERLCSEVNGLRVTFCKSGKDRTGMAVTLEQSRVLGERFSCGNSAARVLRDANIMREYGCRILIAEKNIGRKIYSINSLQTQFIPLLYRPPVNTQEYLIKGTDLS